jgi:hypothetical protein
MRPVVRNTRNANMPSRMRKRRRRAGMPKRRRQASAAPPWYQRMPGSAGRVRLEVVGAVVVIVSVAVPAVVPVMETGLVEPKLRVGRSCAPEGLEARVAVRATLPVKPLLGVTVTATVLPVVDPGVTVRGRAARVRPGGPGVTVTDREEVFGA